jgi:hypothetical protein
MIRIVPCGYHTLALYPQRYLQNYVSEGNGCTMEFPGHKPSECYANVLLSAGRPRPSRRFFLGIHAENR